MTARLGVVMDPIAGINPKKDSTLAMLLAAQARHWELWYMETGDLSLRNGRPHGRVRALRVYDDAKRWFSLGEAANASLSDLDVILMRKDPPVDAEYLYATAILELAEGAGAVVVNRPRSLRDCNEKLYAQHFPQCTPPTLVSCDAAALKAFLEEHGDIVLKPLDAMGGASIFRLTVGEVNTNVVIETLTARGTRHAMAQRFIPEVRLGDKRILMIDGEPIPYALARIPQKGEFRGNLAAGGRGMGVPLSEHDLWICGEVGPDLRARGLTFVGLDVIGDYLTEINVTSPTCIRELDALYGLDIAASLLTRIEAMLG